MRRPKKHRILESVPSVAMSANVVEVKSLDQLRKLPAYADGLVVINFYAPWSDLSKELAPVVSTLAAQHSSITFAKVCFSMPSICDLTLFCTA